MPFAYPSPRPLKPLPRRLAWRPGMECLEQRRVPATFLVDTLADTPAVDLSTGRDADGAVSLRGAVMAANAHPGADVIVLPAGEFILGGSGPNEDQAAAGDLDIHGSLAILGQGREHTRITTAGAEQPFEVFDGPLHLQGVDLFFADLIGQGPVAILPEGDPVAEPALPPAAPESRADMAAVVDAAGWSLFSSPRPAGQLPPPNGPVPGVPAVIPRDISPGPQADLRARFGVGGPEPDAGGRAEEIVVQTHRAFWMDPGIQPVFFREMGTHPDVTPEKGTAPRSGAVVEPVPREEKRPADRVSAIGLMEIKAGDRPGLEFLSACLLLGEKCSVIPRPEAARPRREPFR